MKSDYTATHSLDGARKQHETVPERLTR
jgi:hypothetical protein